MKLSPKRSLPILVLLVSLAVTALMFASRRAPTSAQREGVRPAVSTHVLAAETATFSVRSHGTVEPRTESDLVAEVAGRILWVSPRLAAGSFFEAGDLLVRINSRVYADNLASAEAALARAQSQLTLSRAGLERERSMGKGGASSRAKLDSALHDTESAEAGLREARVAVNRATYDLERCEVRAPFAGRVRETFVDLGEYSVPGGLLARVYAIDYAEVRVAIPDRDLAFLDLSLGYRGDPLLPESAELDAEGPELPSAVLTADFAGSRHTWFGKVVRVEGALDPKTRMIHLVVRVDDPYGRDAQSDRAPLAVGLFVEAEIRGKSVAGVFAVPRTALRGDREVLIVDSAGHLRVREVDIVRAERERIWVRAGVEAGERVAVTGLSSFVEGMLVRVSPPSAPISETVVAQGAGR